MIPPQALVFPLQAFKGKNLGRAGSAFDIPTDRCSFHKGGGPDIPDEVYCDVSDGYRVQKPLTKGGVRLFDFSKPFTIGMWVRFAPNVACGCFLFSTLPLWGPRWAFWPSKKNDQLSFYFGRAHHSSAVSTIDRTNVEHWRHIVVRYRPPTDLRFLLNGENWSLLRGMTSITGRKTAQDLIMWHFGHPGEHYLWEFTGQMACVTVFQMALPEVETKRLKNRCG